MLSDLIRPVRMLDAFRELGFEVLTVTGSARERSRRLRALRARLEGGQSIEFLYSECATIPTMLTEPRHLPPHPLLDPSLMRLVRRHGVPTSLFYRDIYWVFPDYRERVGAAVAGAMCLVYRYDLASDVIAVTATVRNRGMTKKPVRNATEPEENAV